MSLVNVRNCIRFYQTAEELNASTLMNYCAEIIASHWVSKRLRSMNRALTLAARDTSVSPASVVAPGHFIFAACSIEKEAVGWMVCEACFCSESVLRF